MIPLEPSPEQMREMGEAALEYLIGFFGGLPDAPAADVEGALEVARSLHSAPPEDGIGFEPAMDAFTLAASKAFEPAGPGYLAFIPGGGLFSAALASFLANGVNRFTNLAAPAPALVQMEVDVVRWLCDLFELPAGSQGILTTGGSMANFSAIVTARVSRLPQDFLGGTIYVSDQAHASVAKAARLAGFPAGNVRVVGTDAQLRLDPDRLAEDVRADRAAGRTPFCAVGSAGTTNTGAIDPLDGIADLCAAEEMWFHVDAAYGGFFRLTDRGRQRLRGIERADSITLDPHKGMFLPYGTGSLVVREGDLLREAHSMGAEYLQDLETEKELPNFADYSPELSRDHRGLRAWLPLQLHGVSAFRDALEEKLDLTEVLADALRADPNLELPWEPDLTVVPFRLRPRTGDLEDANGANRELLERINASKRVFLSSTMIDGRFTLRACIVSHRTHRDRIDETIGIVRDAAADVQRPPPRRRP